MCGVINGSLIVVMMSLAAVILCLCGCFVRKISCVLHKYCNCNKIMVVTFTANCWFYRKFWAVMWASLELFGWSWAWFMRTLGCFFNQHLATLICSLRQWCTASGFWSPIRPDICFFGLDWLSFPFQSDPDPVYPNEIKCCHAKNLDME